MIYFAKLSAVFLFNFCSIWCLINLHTYFCVTSSSWSVGMILNIILSFLQEFYMEFYKVAMLFSYLIHYFFLLKYKTMS